jgi:hypothetical protein
MMINDLRDYAMLMYHERPKIIYSLIWQISFNVFYEAWRCQSANILLCKSFNNLLPHKNSILSAKGA